MKMTIRGERGLALRWGALVLVLVAVASLGSASCGSDYEVRGGGLHIHITINQGPDDLADAEDGQRGLSVADADIVEFKWDTQTVVLTDEAMERVWEQLPGSLPLGWFTLSFNYTELVSGTVSRVGSATAFEGPNLYVGWDRTLYFTSGYWREADALLSFGIPRETVDAIRDHFVASGRLWDTL